MIKKALIIVILLAATVAIAGDFYRLRGVSRVDQDLYKTLDNVYIQTRYCYQYVYGEDAILYWDGIDGSWDNEIIWEDGTKCDVKRIWR